MSKKKITETLDLGLLTRLAAPSETLDSVFAKNSMPEFFQMSESATEDIGEFLTTFSLNLSVAESCTGGLLGACITQVSGVSLWFNGGFITYSNEAKVKQLGVEERTLEKYGAVSALTVCQMATGACENSNSSVGLSISGIAGPDGGTESKPVGTVWIGLRIPNSLKEDKAKFKKEFENLIKPDPERDYSWIMSAQLLKNAYLIRETPTLSVPDGEAVAREFLLHGDRNSIRQSACLMALYFLYEFLIAE